MSDDPDDWYKATLQRKHESQMFAAQISYWLPRVLAIAAVTALIIIAVRV